MRFLSRAPTGADKRREGRGRKAEAAGFGRIKVKVVPSERASYIAKYLGKTFANHERPRGVRMTMMLYTDAAKLPTADGVASLPSFVANGVALGVAEKQNLKVTNTQSIRRHIVGTND